MSSSLELQRQVANELPGADNPIHRVLFCADLLSCIAEEATIPTLRSLSLCCSRFEDSALAVMWRDLPTSHHALRILTSYAIDHEYQFWVFNRPIDALELQRFKYYAKFVRRITSPFSSIIGGPVDIQPSVFDYISRAMPGQTIFPLLRGLTLNVANHDHLPSVKYIMSPSLVDLTFHLTPGVLPNSELSSLPKTIRRLRLSGSFLYSEVLPIIQAAQTLSLSDLSLMSYEKDPARSLESLFCVLPLYKDLQHLEVVLPPEFDLGIPVDNLKSFTLIKLEGRPCQLSQVIALFSAVVHMSLTIIDGYSSSDEHQYVANIFANIALNSVDTLQSIKIHTKSESRWPTPIRPTFRLPECIGALLHIRGITKFTYLDKYSSDLLIGDAHIARIMNSWPRLAHFSLASTTSHRDESSGITLKGLRIISRLHDLEFLELTVDYHKLRVLLLPVDESINGHGNFLSTLFQHSPRITHLSLFGPITSVFLLNLHRFQALEQLYVRFPERVFGELATQKQAFQTLLDTLAQLPSMTTLSVNFPSRGSFPLATAAACRNIQNIHFYGPSREIKKQLCSFHNLEEVALEFSDTTKQVQANIKACSQRLLQSSTSLHSLRLISHSPVSVLACVSALFGVPSIRRFAVEGSTGNRLSDAEISEMVQAWPLLEQFSFIGDPQDLGDASLISLGRLQHLWYLRLLDTHIPLKQLPDPCNSDEWSEYKLLTRFFSPSQLTGSKIFELRAALHKQTIVI